MTAELRSKAIKITVKNSGTYHHMPDNASTRDLTGLTLRAALSALRDEDWGHIGGMYGAELSDGTMLSVHLRASDGGSSSLMSSQYIARTGHDLHEGRDYTIRTYAI